MSTTLERVIQKLQNLGALSKDRAVLGEIHSLTHREREHLVLEIQRLVGDGSEEEVPEEYMSALQALNDVLRDQNLSFRDIAFRKESLRRRVRPLKVLLSIPKLILDLTPDDSEQALSRQVIADEHFPVFTAGDPVGWTYINDPDKYPEIVNPLYPSVGTNKKINWYLGGNDSASNLDWSMSNFQCMYARVRFNNDPVGSNTRPFFILHTHLQGDGEGVSTWHRSRQVYNSYSKIPKKDEDVIIYVRTDPRECGIPLEADRFIEVRKGSTSTPGGGSIIDDTEIIRFLSLHTNSSAPVANYNFTVLELGFSVKDRMQRALLRYSEKLHSVTAV